MLRILLAVVVGITGSHASYIIQSNVLPIGFNFTSIPFSYLGAQEFDTTTVRVFVVGEELCDDNLPTPEKLIQADADEYPFAILSVKKVSSPIDPAESFMKLMMQIIYKFLPFLAHTFFV